MFLFCFFLFFSLCMFFCFSYDFRLWEATLLAWEITSLGVSSSLHILYILYNLYNFYIVFHQDPLDCSRNLIIFESIKQVRNNLKCLRQVPRRAIHCSRRSCAHLRTSAAAALACLMNDIKNTKEKNDKRHNMDDMSDNYTYLFFYHSSVYIYIYTYIYICIYIYKQRIINTYIYIYTDIIHFQI